MRLLLLAARTGGGVGAQVRRCICSRRSHHHYHCGFLLRITGLQQQQHLSPSILSLPNNAGSDQSSTSSSSSHCKYYSSLAGNSQSQYQQKQINPTTTTTYPMALRRRIPHGQPMQPSQLQARRWKGGRGKRRRRAGNKDGNKAWVKPRPPSKKELRAYRKKTQLQQNNHIRDHHETPTAAQQETNRRNNTRDHLGKVHGKPGSRAFERRQWAAAAKRDLLRDTSSPEYRQERAQLDAWLHGEYDMSDAVLDDLMGNTSELSSLAANPEPVYLGHLHQKYYNRVADQMDSYRQRMEQLKQQREGKEEHGDENLLRTNLKQHLKQQQEQEQAAFASARASVEDKQDDGKEQSDEKNITGAVATSELQLLQEQDAEELLPSDHDISLVLRSYRDRGTRSQPVGLVAVLQHLIQDLRLPMELLGEKSYTSLLTACRTPAEGRRVLEMMQRQNHPVSAYSWSILVDLHARVGDVPGCQAVLQEALEAGIPPTQAAVTSLLAACHKVCRDGGRNSHAVRDQAAKAGDEAWHNLKTVALGPDSHPDAMAYGAYLRLCAIRGRAEACINLLEEMQRFDVKPTTLCFTAALQAVAKSHEIAVRFERGASRKNLRSAMVAQHHGKLARGILVAAENAEVPTSSDKGFVAALIMCSAAAGDLATAKAIYTAAQIRESGHALRPVGSNEHLERLRGEGARHGQQLYGSGEALQEIDAVIDTAFEEALHLSSGESTEVSSSPVKTPWDLDEHISSANETPATGNASSYPVVGFAEREYGKDSRVLSALLHACAVAADKNGLGALWQGRENGGFLCLNSLRLINARRQPRYTDTDIPGLGRTDALTWDGDGSRKVGNEDYRPGKRNQRRFGGVEESMDVSTSMEDLEEDMIDMFLDDRGRLKKEYRKTTPEDVWFMKYGRHDPFAVRADENREIDFISADDDRNSDDDADLANNPVLQQTGNESVEEMYFDNDTMRWKTRRRQKMPRERGIEEFPELVETMQQAETQKEEGKAAKITSDTGDEKGELYFDNDAMRWKTRTKVETVLQKQQQKVPTEYESGILLERRQQQKAARAENDTVDLDPDEFAKFYAGLKDMALAEEEYRGEGDITEEEAKELFLMMKDEYNEMMSMDVNEVDVSDFEAEVDNSHASSSAITEWEKHDDIDDMATKNSDEDEEQFVMEKVGGMFNLTKRKKAWVHDSVGGLFNSVDNSSTVTVSADLAGPQSLSASTTSQPSTPHLPDSAIKQATADWVEEIPSLRSVRDGAFTETIEKIDAEDSGETYDELSELRALLPSFSDKRLRKIRRVFHKSLADPSLLDLVPVVRERMPDYITSTWLKQWTVLTARHVVQQASEHGLVDVHVLNSALELETSSGNLDKALQFHDVEYARNKIKPTGYSDRLVLQMFLKNNRWQRALEFKQKVESCGRKLDIPAYASLIEYCGHHRQLGSAILMLKECISLHEAAPAEASLSKLRLLCRESGLEEEVGLVDMVGEDPVEWLRYGEAMLKREYSKKGRRDIPLARNVLIQT